MGDPVDEAYDGAPCGLLTTLPNGMIQRVNRTFCSWFAFTEAELVNKKRLQDLLTTGCKIFHQTHWLPLLQMQGSVAEVQLELLHRDGHAIPVLVNAIQAQRGAGMQHDLAVFVAADRRRYERELLLARRRAEELLATVRDAQKALSLAEARLRLALDSAQLVVWDVDPTSGQPRYEDGVQRLLGISEHEHVSAEVYREHIHPADLEAEHRAFDAALASTGPGTYSVEYRLLGRDGVERSVMSSGRALVDDPGGVPRFSGVLQDVTTRRKAEAALRDQERQARERALLTEQLIGIVSHDLRTPLQVVAMGVSLLGAEDLGPSQARTLWRIGAAATRASRLVADLLDFTQARLGTGIPVVSEEIDIHEVIADVAEELRLAWPGRMIDHQTCGEGRVVADPDRIAQVITNLGGNALTYGQSTMPVVIKSTVTPRELVLEVHNEGGPIPEHLLPHIFEPLRRGEQQVKLGSRSVGLGLYIVQEITAAHGGKVTVTSTLEQGTTFTVRVPARPSDNVIGS